MQVNVTVEPPTVMRWICWEMEIEFCVSTKVVSVGGCCVFTYWCDTCWKPPAAADGLSYTVVPWGGGGVGDPPCKVVPCPLWLYV